MRLGLHIPHSHVAPVGNPNIFFTLHHSFVALLPFFSSTFLDSRHIFEKPVSSRLLFLFEKVKKESKTVVPDCLMTGVYFVAHLAIRHSKNQGQQGFDPDFAVLVALCK